MTLPACSMIARPPARRTACRSDQRTFCGGSSARDGTSRGRMPVRSVCSAMRAERLDERTAEYVPAASTSVPPAVASDEIVCQSATPNPTARLGSGWRRSARAAAAQIAEEARRDRSGHLSTDAAALDQHGEREVTAEADEPGVGRGRGAGAELCRARLAEHRWAGDIGDRAGARGDDRTHEPVEVVGDRGGDRRGHGSGGLRWISDKRWWSGATRGHRGGDEGHGERARNDATLTDGGGRRLGGIGRRRELTG